MGSWHSKRNWGWFSGLPAQSHPPGPFVQHIDYSVIHRSPVSNTSGSFSFCLGFLSWNLLDHLIQSCRSWKATVASCRALAYWKVSSFFPFCIFAKCLLWAIHCSSPILIQQRHTGLFIFLKLTYEYFITCLSQDFCLPQAPSTELEPWPGHQESWFMVRILRLTCFLWAWAKPKTSSKTFSTPKLGLSVGLVIETESRTVYLLRLRGSSPEKSNFLLSAFFFFFFMLEFFFFF